MDRSLRIVLAETDVQMLEFFLITIKHLGHQIIAVVDSVAGVASVCRRTSPDLVVCALTLADGDGIEAARQVAAIRPTPFVLAAAYLDSALLGQDVRQCAIACFVQPIDITNLKTTIDAAFNNFQSLVPIAGGSVNMTAGFDRR